MRVSLGIRLRAWLLLATFVGTFGLTGLNADHLGIIDIACGAVELAVGDKVPQVGTASPGTAQHCPICHFQRAVSGATVATVARVEGPQCQATRVATTSHKPPTVEATTRLSRGPPADARPPVVIT